METINFNRRKETTEFYNESNFCRIKLIGVKGTGVRNDLMEFRRTVPTPSEFAVKISLVDTDSKDFSREEHSSASLHFAIFHADPPHIPHAEFAEICMFPFHTVPQVTQS